MNMKLLKIKAKKALKLNYWHIVAVAFFVSIMIGFFSISSSPNIKYNNLPLLNSINSDILKETIESITSIKVNILAYKPTRGFLASIFNNITSSGSFLFGILNSFNQLFFHGRIWASIIILFGALIAFLYWLLVRNPLIVGQARFFLENKNFSKTSFKRIFMPFKIKKSTHISFVMLKKTLKEWLWYFTIIGGFIKHYAYALTPFILAENPNLTFKEVINLSEKLMNGHKFELFKIDLSFIIWEFLDIFTFHLLYIVFIKPYKYCCLSEFYFEIRKKYLEINPEDKIYLCDNYLLETGDNYPQEKYIYPEHFKKSWINTDIDKNYSLTSLILMFFAAAIIGWIWEVSFHLFQFGNFVNRGALHGPWLPIYGWGAIILLIILKKWRKNPVKTFCLSIFLCGIIEYGTSCYLEYFKDARWWDYDGYFLNLHGRICLEGLLAFGIGGCAFIYFAAPFIESTLSCINNKIKIIFCILLSICFLTDQIYSSKYPNIGSGINENINIDNIKKS